MSRMHPLVKAAFFRVPVSSGRNVKKVKSFTQSQEKEMKEFTKQLREKGRHYTYSFLEGNNDIPTGNEQLSLVDSNTTKNILHIIKYI